MKFNRIVLMLALSLSAQQAFATLLLNGDFETGDFTGWTQFTTTQGTLGPGFPNVTPFDTNNDTVATNSAQFRVGDAVADNGVQEGGGIFQNFNLMNAGIVSFSADIAAFDPDGGNSEWGIFSLLIDGVVVDSHQFGSNFLAPGTSLHEGLAADLALAAGMHEFRILMTRPFIQLPATPVQYIDNAVALSAAAVPEPATLSLLGLGLAALAARSRRRR